VDGVEGDEANKAEVTGHADAMRAEIAANVKNRAAEANEKPVE